MRAAVEGLTDEQLDTPYREGGWTVRQVVHHVVDSHLNSYVRFKIGMTEDLQRTIHHPEMGRDLTLDTLLELYGWHCLHHETHITALRERMGW